MTRSSSVIERFVPTALAALFAGCSSMAPLQSQLTSTPPSVDGDVGEWSGTMQAVEDHPVRLGLRNDDQFVYLSIQSMDETLMRKILLGGLTIWFNSEGDRTRSLGIRYPVPRDPSRPIRVERQEPSSEPPGERRNLREMEIVGPDAKAVRYTSDEVPGILAQTFIEFGSFTYELRIPIESSAAWPYAVNPGEDGVFGFGFESGEIDLSRLAAARQDTGGAAVGGGRTGGGGRGRRGGGRGGAGARAGARAGGGAAGLTPELFWCRISLGSGSE